MSDWEDAPDDGGWEDAPEAAAKPAPPPEATAADRAMAFGAGSAKGAAGILGLPVDTVTNIVNLAIAGYETNPIREKVREKTGQAPIEPVKKPFLGSEHIAEIMGRLGIQTDNLRPDDTASRLLHRGGTIAGGSLFPGATIKSTLAASTGGAIAGEAPESLGGEAWTGVGAISPSAALAGARAARARVAEKVRPKAEHFWATGATPSVGQATGSHFFQGLENLAAKFPGGAGVMDAFRKNQQAKLGASASTGVSAENAGRAIETGITGKGGFIERTKAKWVELDDAVAAKIPAGEGIAPTNTLTALDRLTAPTVGAEATSGVMATPKLMQIKEALKSDMAGQPPTEIRKILGQNGETILEIPIGGTPGKETMPYQAIRELRSKVGALLDDALVTGIPGGELKQVYGALSRDLEAAANKAGAGKEFARQNDYYRARMARIEGVLEKVIGKDKLPEDIFKSFMPTDRDAANKVRSVMRSLEPAERQVVTEAVINRLGRATPGKQNEIGDVFSSETFLTNWSRLSPGAKAQLFESEKTRTAMDALSKTASDIRDGGKAFANTSGTAGSFAAYELYSAPIKAAAALGGAGAVGGAVVAGGIPAALGIIGGALSAAAIANLGSKALTNPRLIEWLAQAPKVKPNNMPAHLARLGVIYNEADDETKSELDKFMKSLTAQEPDWDKKGKLPPFTGGPLKGPGVGVPVQPYAMATRS